MLLLLVLACAGDTGAPGKTPGGGGGRGDDAPVELRLQPTSLEFGTVIAGTEVEQYISVGNQGRAAVDLTARVDVDLPQAFAFEPASLHIGPGDYANVRVVFKPEAWALFDGALVLTDASGADVAAAVIAAEVQADRDGDGYGAARHGGPDCDDDDPDVNPEGDDVWYDGVDGDCDGRSDWDADGDGYDAAGGATPVDCDDTDPSRSPGATEVWYDGVDADCAGDDDFDADADGVPSDAFGGADCLDDDPRLDGLGCIGGDLDPADHGIALGGGGGLGLDLLAGDHDGDGWTDLLVAETERVLWLAGPLTAAEPTTAPAWIGRDTDRLALADLDGDGVQDLLTGVPGSGAARWIPGPVTGGGDLRAGVKLRTPGAADRPVVVTTADDLDGDGVDEVVVGWSGQAARPHLAPGARVYAGGTTADAVVSPGAADDAAGAALLGPGDLDGDGYGDLLLGGPGGDGQVWLVLGAATVSGLTAGDARLVGASGDGLGATLAWHDGRAWVGRARDGALVAIDGAWSGTVSLSADAVAVASASPVSSADIDGDGTLDLLTRAPAGSAVWPGPLGASAGPRVRATEAAGGIASADTDGDAWTDLLIGDPARDTVWILPGPVRGE